ncbi:MAG: AmmeMemoRadiSam system protein B [Candidatus Omnitrophota bacterium]
MAVREPVVAGSFYPAEAPTLKRFCESYLKPRRGLVTAHAVLLPHAGYVYSGRTACETLARVHVPDLVLLIGPNHHGWGASFSMMTEGTWRTPLGEVPIDPGLAHALGKASGELSDDPDAHAQEHSLEVEIPFLQTKNPSLRIVPLLIGTSDTARIRRVAQQIGPLLASWPEKLLLVISSDMNHYESDAVTHRKDHKALAAIEKLDAEGLAETVHRSKISMCGFAAAYLLLCMKGILPLTKATVADYRTSGPVSGDLQRVVGYAGIIFE